MLRIISLLFIINLSFSCRPLDDLSSLSSVNDHEIDHIQNHANLISAIYPSAKTNKSIANGAKGKKYWDINTTWQGDSLPGEESIVVIPEGVTVQIRTDVKVKAIEVKGTLIIDGNNTEIDVEVETIYVAAKAAFKIGSSKSPINSKTPVNITFIKLESEKGSQDIHVHKRGLISMGQIEIYGRE